jgi:hypothetical protein
MPFRCEILTANDPKWYQNNMIFRTAAETERYGLDLILRWTGSRDYRVIETAESVTYAIVNDKITRVEKGEE